MNVFRFVPGGLTGVLFPGETTSPATSFPLLPTVLYVKLRPHGLFPVHFVMCTGIILVHLMFVS